MSDAVEYWFRSMTLPWNQEIEDFLDDKGVETVEHLKLLTKDQWIGLFSTAKDIVKLTAEKVYNDYLDEEIDLKKCATELHLKPAPSVKNTAAKKAPHKDDGSSKKMNTFGFTVTVTKTKDQKIKEKKIRDRKRTAEEQLERGAELSDGDEEHVVEMIVDNDDDEDGDDDNRKLPALPPSDWHCCRCALSQNLNDPVSSDSKLVWDNSLLPPDKQPGKDVTDLEDTLGYYKAVGCNKTTSDEALKTKVEEELKKARKKMTRFHQDRAATADANKYSKWKKKYDKIKQVKDELCTEDDNGCYPSRVAYDEKGEELIDLMVENITDTYNCSIEDRISHVKECMRREKIYAKKKESYTNVANELLTSRIARQWNTAKGGQQTNKVRLLICEAFKKNYNNADIALEIRKVAFRREYFNENQKSRDKIYESISRQIRRLKQQFDGGLLGDLLGLSGKEKLKALKKKSINPNARGRKQLNSASSMEADLGRWITKLEEEEKRITRTMIFRKALELDPGFYGGDIKRLKKWFYYGFVKRFELSIRKIASVGQKLPRDWEAKMVEMRGRVRHRQQPLAQPDGRVLITGVTDAYYFNTDHVPVWVESVGNYTWGRKSSGRRSVKTGGKEKDRFTVQLGVGKGGKKVIPFIIFKAEPTKYDPSKPRSHKYGSKNSVAREIYERKPDSNGNHYPSRDKVYMTVASKATSNHALTKVYLNKCILPAGGYDKATGECENKIGVLWDDFKSHSTPVVKDYCLSLPFLSVDILPGGLTPCGQPLDKVINKVFKGYFRDLYDAYILSAPLTEKGTPLAPSRQQLATWVVEAWDKIPEEMVRKSWTACGYTPEGEISFSDRGQIVPWTEDAVHAMVKEFCGQEGLDHLCDEENGNEDDIDMIEAAFGIVDEDGDDSDVQLD